MSGELRSPARVSERDRQTGKGGEREREMRRKRETTDRASNIRTGPPVAVSVAMGEYGEGKCLGETRRW